MTETKLTMILLKKYVKYGNLFKRLTYGSKLIEVGKDKGFVKISIFDLNDENIINKMG